MTTAQEVMSSLKAVGVVLTFNPSGLRVRAPREVITPEHRAAINAHRDELLSLVIAEHDMASADPVDQSVPVPLPIKRTLGRNHAGNLAAKFSREEIESSIARFEARAAEPGSSDKYPQLISDWKEILAARKRMTVEESA